MNPFQELLNTFDARQANL